MRPEPVKSRVWEFGVRPPCIRAASLALGHANIGLTARRYLDNKGRTTVGLGHLLPAASDSVIQIPDTVRYPNTQSLAAVPQSKLCVAI